MAASYSTDAPEFAFSSTDTPEEAGGLSLAQSRNSNGGERAHKLTGRKRTPSPVPPPAARPPRIIQTDRGLATSLRDQYAAARGFTVIGEYVDIGISGSKESRPELNRLFSDARRWRFDAVLVARFDRFARSTRHLVLAPEEFQALGTSSRSTSRLIPHKMVYVVIGAVAELERSLIRERMMMGLQRAKAQGKALRRPRVTSLDVDGVTRLKASGLSVREIARLTGTSKTSVSRVLTLVP